MYDDKLRYAVEHSNEPWSEQHIANAFTGLIRERSICDVMTGSVFGLTYVDYDNRPAVVVERPKPEPKPKKRVKPAQVKPKKPKLTAYDYWKQYRTIVKEILAYPISVIDLKLGDLGKIDTILNMDAYHCTLQITAYKNLINTYTKYVKPLLLTRFQYGVSSSVANVPKMIRFAMTLSLEDLQEVVSARKMMYNGFNELIDRDAIITMGDISAKYRDTSSFYARRIKIVNKLETAVAIATAISRQRQEQSNQIEELETKLTANTEQLQKDRVERRNLLEAVQVLRADQKTSTGVLGNIQNELERIIWPIARFTQLDLNLPKLLHRVIVTVQSNVGRIILGNPFKCDAMIACVLLLYYYLTQTYGNREGSEDRTMIIRFVDPNCPDSPDGAEIHTALNSGTIIRGTFAVQVDGITPELMTVLCNAIDDDDDRHELYISFRNMPVITKGPNNSITSLDTRWIQNVSDNLDVVNANKADDAMRDLRIVVSCINHHKREIARLTKEIEQLKMSLDSRSSEYQNALSVITSYVEVVDSIYPGIGNMITEVSYE